MYWIYPQCLNDVQGGRSILGLDGHWTIYRKGGKGIEISIGRSHKVPMSYIQAGVHG